MSTDPRSHEIETTLAGLDVHREWTDNFLSGENDRFFELAFDSIATVLNPARGGGAILDAGCGPGAQSIRLARRGFTVVAMDFSASVLEEAARNVEAAGLQDRISLRRENLTALSFPDGAFEHVLCWGVLMHIPDVEAAVSELARVLAPDGLLAIGENNAGSVQTAALRALRSALGAAGAIRDTPAGMEYWKDTPAGPLLVRDANIPWLIRSLERRGLVLRRHTARQFTELYTKVPLRPLKQAIHTFNNLWFSRVRNPHPAFGNLLIFQKRPA